MKHTELYRIGAGDVDMDGRLTVGSVLRFAQETANCQHEKYGPKISDLRRDGKAFVLSRLSMDLGDHVGLNCKTVSSETWLKSVKGFIIERNTQITEGERQDRRSLASVSAIWGLIDLSTRRPIRADKMPLGFTTDSDTSGAITPLRFSLPPDSELTLIRSHTVSFSECDENRHMNNVLYAPMFIDCMQYRPGYRIKNFSISYINEAVFGAEFDIYGTSAEDGDGIKYFFRTLLKNGTHGTECIITYTDR